MPGRDKSLITRNGIPDPQAYNPQTGQWESFVGVSWGKTAGGLYVPIRVDDQGRQEVTLSGTIKGMHSIGRSGNLNAKTTETVVETTAEVIVQSLLFTSSVRSTDVYFTVQVQKADGTWVNIGRIISPTLVGFNHHMNAFDNKIWASTLWTELKGPGENDRVIALNTSVERRFKGLKIVIANNTDDNIDFAVALLYSEVI